MPDIHPLAASFLRSTAQTRRGTAWSATTKHSARYVFAAWDRWLATNHLELVTVSRYDVERYLEQRRDSVAPATVSNDWKALRALYRWLAVEGEIDRDPVARVSLPNPPETPVRVLTDAEYNRLIATCDRRTLLGRRDEAMLSLMWWSGVRRSEVVHADLAGLDLDNRRLTLGSRQFATKTGKVRSVPLAAETVQALDRYLRRRGDTDGPLFVSVRTGERLQPNAIQLLLRRRATAARLGRNVGAHEFRRAMATRHKRAGGSDGSLMAIAGWKGIRMIDRYTRMEREELAAEEFHRLIDTSSAVTRRRRRVG